LPSSQSTSAMQIGELLGEHPSPLLAFSAAGWQRIEEVIGMPAQLLGDRGGWPALLPAIADQLADEGALVLAFGSQKLLEAAFGFAIQPDGEWHGPRLDDGLRLIRL
jgi:hypothetical protein